MSPAQRLRFVVPKARAFVEALTALEVSGPVLLVGDGDLANEVGALAASVGVALIARLDLPDIASLASYRVLVFTEQDGERLGQLLLACLDLNDVCVIAPVTTRYFSRMPLFVVSIPKAGTHLVYELARALGYAPGVELLDFPRPQTWYCVEYSNSHTVARDFFVDTVRRAPFGNRHHPAVRSPVLFAYRHPLDILVSEAHYYHRDGKTAFSGYFDGLDFEARVGRLMDDEWLLGSLRRRVGGFLPWLEMPNVIPVSFEELVGEAGGASQSAQHRLIWSILLKLQVDGCVAELAGKVFNKDSATFREGKIGAWRDQLTSAQVAQLEAGCSDVISAFGYSTQAEAPLLPGHASQYVARPLRFPATDFEGMPLTVVPGFMGCNLVRYAGRFYAVPLSAGKVALEALPGARRARLPVAETLDELRAVLLIGRKAYDRQHASLAAAGEALADGVESLAFWKDSATPCQFDEYKGYNLVAWQGRYLALRQAIGPVDLSRDLAALMAAHAFGDVLVASNLDDLLTHADGVSPAMHMAVEAARREAALIEAAGQREAVLGQRLTALEGRAVAMREDRAQMQAEAARREAALIEAAGQREAVLGQRLTALEDHAAAMREDRAQMQAEAARREAALIEAAGQREAALDQRLTALEGRAAAMREDRAQMQTEAVQREAMLIEAAGQREAALGQRLTALEGCVAAMREDCAQMQAEAAQREAMLIEAAGQREAALGQRLTALEGRAVAMREDRAQMQTEAVQREAMLIEAAGQREAALGQRLTALEGRAVVRLERFMNKLFRRG